MRGAAGAAAAAAAEPAPPPDQEPEPVLDKTRHVRYWTRCLKTQLPRHYTGNESNRMFLGFFIISALDLLGAWEAAAPAHERAAAVDWIYHCQHPDGGFRMWPGTGFGARRDERNAAWDPANMPATYFALCALLASGDDLARVQRRRTLQWVARMQRRDGSFGETLVHGRIQGGTDPRFGYCAAGVRYILRGGHAAAAAPLRIDGAVVADIDVDALVRCIARAESYDGGIADQPFHEPHAGYAFCALGALRFLGRLQTPATPAGPRAPPMGPSDPSMTIRWLAERQTALDPADDEAEPDPAVPAVPAGSEPQAAGMNGRRNKVADTCYAWWAGASFYMLGEPRLFGHDALRRYLLGKTQHPVLGGFGKYPGDPPDLYHSCLGLAALGLMGVEGVKPVDPTMCISQTASARLPRLWRAWGGEG